MGARARIALVCCLVSASGAGCGAPRSHLAPGAVEIDSLEVVLPTWDCGEHFLVEATLDGVGPLAMIVDTGFGGMALTHDVARRLPLPTQQGLRVAELEVGAVRFREVPFFEIDLHRIPLEMGTHVDGVLGFSVFRDLLLTFDYPARQVRVRRGELTPGSDAFGDTVYYEPDPRPHLPLAVGREVWMALVDTGAIASVHVPSFARLALAHEPAYLGHGLAVSGEFTMHAARSAMNAWLGPVELERPILVEVDTPPLVGAGVLRHFVLTFDQDRALVRFEPTERGAVPASPLRHTGALLLREADAWLVSGVLPGTCAERVGVQVGDRVVAIDGQPASEIGCEHGRVLSAEVQGWTIERGEEELQLVVSAEIVVE